MTDFNDIFNQAANATNEDVVSEGGFNPLEEGIYNLTITDVRFDPFENGQSFAVDYATQNGEQASETFSIETRDKNGAQVKMSRLQNNVNRLTALIVSVQMAGILSADDFRKGDEHVAEVLLALVDLTFWSKVTQRDYEDAKGNKHVNNNFTHSKEEITE